MILGVQFAKKMACLILNYENLWQIRNPSANVKEVFEESSDLMALNFNENRNQEVCCRSDV